MNRATEISLSTDQAKLIHNNKTFDIIQRLAENQCPFAKIFLMKDGSNVGHAARETASAGFENRKVPAFSLKEGLFKGGVAARDFALFGSISSCIISP